MIEAFIIYKTLKNGKNKKRENYDDDDDDNISTAAAIIYLIVMIFSAYSAYNCYPKGRRLIPTTLAFIFPLFYWVNRGFYLINCSNN